MAELTCKRCGNGFTARSDARYCSVTCRSRASKDRRQTRAESFSQVNEGTPTETGRVELGGLMLGQEMHPHQLDLGRELDRGVETTAIQWPRREGKTTTVWAWALGRCEDEPGTQIVTTAQSGVKARDRFMTVARTLDRTYPEHKGGPRVYRGAGHEALEWENGSRLWVVAPKPESVRGDGVDVALVDEPQELGPAESLDLQQALMPLFDTRDAGQIVLLGTPGKVRAGWFWDALRAGEAGKSGHLASIHAADPDDDIDDEAVWLRVHRGIGTLTTLDVIRARRAGMSAQAFAMEYLGLWPGTDDGRAISEELWTAGAAGFAERPPRFGLAYDVSPDSSTASLVAAWRDADKRAHVELITYGDPRTIGKEALRIHRASKMAVTFDEIGANMEVADGLNRARPKAKLNPLKLRDVVTAASSLMTELKAGDFRHPDQPDLNAAAEAVAWRDIGDSGRLFGRRASAGDVTPIVAASLALLAADRLPAVQPVKIHTRRSA